MSSPAPTTLPSASVGSLDHTYTPTGKDCNSVLYASGASWPWLQRGPAAETGQLACLPPDWRKDVRAYYSPGVCPSGFTYAFTSPGTDGTSTATCCPSGYVTRSMEGMLNNDYNLCRSWVASTSIGTISSYNYEDDSEGQMVFTFPPGTYVDARGVVVQRQETDPLWNLATQTESSSSPASSTASSTNGGAGGSGDSSDSGLTTGAKAGIGVGVGVGVLLIMAVVFAAYRIGKGKRQDYYQQQQQQMQQLNPYQQHMMYQQQQPGLSPYGGDEGWKSGQTTPIPPQAWSQQTPQPVHELHGNGRTGELDGWGNSVNEMSGGTTPATEMPPGGSVGK